MPPFRNLENTRFGRLVALSTVGKIDGGYVWKCVCDCGNYVNVRSNSLVDLNTKSCGCLSIENGQDLGYRFGKENSQKGNARKYHLNNSYFDNIDTEEKAYWLGFISADGCVSCLSENNLVLSIGLKKDDYKHLETFVSCLESNYPVRLYSTYCSLVINSTRLCESLIKLGVTPRKSKTLQAYNDIKEELVRHYWRGFVDGDGCIRIRSDGYFEIGLVGTFDVCDSFSKWIASTGIVARAAVHPIRNFYGIRYSGLSLPRQVSTLLYVDSSVYLERKHKIWQEIMCI